MNSPKMKAHYWAVVSAISGTLAVLLLAAEVLAQGGGEPGVGAGFPGELVAILFNAGLTAVIVQVLKVKAMPALKANMPWVLPIIALVAAPAVSYVTVALANFLGAPVDLSAITAVLTGALASSGYSIVSKAQS